MPQPTRRTVLLVEDSEADAELASLTLQEPDEGFDVLVAPTLAAAHDLLAKRHVDCVVIDLGLPDATGLDVLHSLLAATTSVPVVVLTGRDDAALGVAAMRSGADDYLRKTDVPGSALQLSVSRAIERAALRVQQQVLASIVTSSVDAIAMLSPDGRILTWNQGAVELFGYTPEQVIGQHVSLLQPPGIDAPDYLLSAARRGEPVRAVDATRRRRDGSCLPVSITMSPLVGPDGTVTAISKIVRDISHAKQLEEDLRRQSLHDDLTGLPNRALLRDRLDQALGSAARRQTPVTVIFCDIDRFKRVNDTYGHLAGDGLLLEVARRLRATVRPDDTVARFAGDEFVIVCEDTTSEEAELVADRIRAAVQQPIVVDGHSLLVSISIGIASGPPLPADASTLLRSADAALYEAKRSPGGPARTFDAALLEDASDRLELEGDLRDALAEGSLEVHYQPQIELLTGRLVGLEALARWTHPRRGTVSPAVFVALAEEGGFVRELDEWVLRRACEDLSWLRARRLIPDTLRVAVNQSAQSVTDLRLVDVVTDAAASAGLPLTALEIEVTETGLLSDMVTACRVLGELRERGITVALDDFGTGFSSFTYVRKLPISTIKIDRSFIENLVLRPDDLAICSAITDMARSLGLRTVGEGVESREQLDALHQLGCQEGQGYLWSKALHRGALATKLTSTPEFASAQPLYKNASRTSRAARGRAQRVTSSHGLQRIEQLHREGASLNTIAAALNGEGFRTPEGMRWHSRKVAGVIVDIIEGRRLPAAANG